MKRRWRHARLGSHAAVLLLLTFGCGDKDRNSIADAASNDGLVTDVCQTSCLKQLKVDLEAAEQCFSPSHQCSDVMRECGTPVKDGHRLECKWSDGSRIALPGVSPGDDDPQFTALSADGNECFQYGSNNLEPYFEVQGRRYTIKDVPGEDYLDCSAGGAIRLAELEECGIRNPPTVIFCCGTNDPCD